MTTSDDRRELKALAEAATPGEWGSYVLGGQTVTDPVAVGFLHGMDKLTYDRTYGFKPADAAYIAAANPQAILSLFADLDTVTRERDEARAEVEHERGQSRGTWTSQRQADLATIETETLRSRLDRANEMLAGATEALRTAKERLDQIDCMTWGGQRIQTMADAFDQMKALAADGSQRASRWLQQYDTREQGK